MVVSPAVCNGFVFVLGCLFIVLLILVMAVIMWLEKLQRNKECECSKDWKRTYILHFLSFLFIWNICTGSYSLYHMYTSQCQGSAVVPLPITILKVVFIGSFILYLVFSYLYAKSLQSKSCSCAMQGIGYRMMQIHMFLATILLLLPFIIPILILLVTIAYLAFKQKK